MKYTKIPIEIEAIQWDGSKKSATKILHWMFPNIEKDAEANDLTIKTLEGEMHATPNDFIIRGVKGEFYPCKPEIFEMTYKLSENK